MINAEYHRIWRVNNPDRVIAARKRYRDNPENKEKERQYSKWYGKSHPRNRAKYHRGWRAKNPTKQSGYSKRHYLTHADQKRSRNSTNRPVSQGVKELPLSVIQKVYETNILTFGTLTCYLCVKPIEFKQDCLEHKLPISRGGDNSENNLAVAHKKCNGEKWKLTELEYLVRKSGIFDD
jgi:5-methylcytosine-specific restriction endonuclease McrA